MKLMPDRKNKKFLYINESVLLFNSSIISKSMAVQGAKRDKIISLESKLGVSLPNAYIEYLLWMGQDRAGLFRGTDCYIDDVIENNLALKETLIEENLSHFCDKESICFSSHQGYILHWFYADDDIDNPKCFEYAEMPDGIEFGECGIFSELLKKLVIDAINSWKQI